jgi:hypothetical protein
MIKEILSKRPKQPPLKVIKGLNAIRGGFQKLTQKIAPPPVVLLDLITGMWVSRAVGVVAQFGVADHF